jgi:peptide deformylase
MIELNLVEENSPVLLSECKEFDFKNPPFDPKEFAKSLHVLMVKNDGLGLSANQTGHSYKVFTIRTKDDEVFALFNPKVVDTSKNEIPMKEGCLSFPLLYLNVKRPNAVRIRYQDQDGEVHTEKFIGMTARIVLHEYDHMNGKVFTTKASTYETQRALRKRMILKRRVKK